jgi:putative FmdB family regulatory protein
MSCAERQASVKISLASHRGLKPMPIYEYECADCHRRASFLTLRISEKLKPSCEKCGSKKMHRLMSRFAMPRSEESRMDALSDPSSFGDLDEKDPKSLARAMRKMGREMGDEFAGPEFDDAVNELESGGDLGGDDDFGGDDDDL